jgi:predicted nucleic acid-binding protein
MASLVDTNILVYRVDPRFPDKQRIAAEVLWRGLHSESLFLPHQAVVEFIAATTRPRGGNEPILALAEAWRHAEELLDLFPVLYPSESVLRAAIHGTAVYRLHWYDAHLWAYAEVHGLDVLLSEDFEHRRWYGSVQTIDPFQEDAPTLHQP